MQISLRSVGPSIDLIVLAALAMDKRNHTFFCVIECEVLSQLMRHATCCVCLFVCVIYARLFMLHFTNRINVMHVVDECLRLSVVLCVPGYSVVFVWSQPVRLLCGSSNI